MKNKPLRDLLILSAVVLAALLPFINKPFNVDDPFYLKAAEQFASDPIHPYSYSINWSGELRNAWGRMEATFPPLVTAYTAAVLKIFGEREWIFHLFFMVFPLAAVFSMYFISRRYTDNPLLPALLTAVCPAFLVTATSIMLDVPLCALMLCSIAFFVHGSESGSAGKMMLGSAAAGCAVLAKYSGILVVPILLLYLIFSKKLKYAAYMIIPLVFLAAWSVHNEIVYGGVHFLLASKHIGKGISPHKIFAFGTFFGGCLIFPIALLFTASLRDVKGIAVWMIGLFIFAKIVLVGPWTAALFAVFCTATLYYVYKILLELKSLDRFVVAWFFVGLCAAMLLEPWISARYLLIILPPAAIIFAKMLDSLPERRRNVLIYAAVSAALVFGVSLTVSDYIWADSYKLAAGRIKDKGYNNGYFIGHFGFQYYLEKAGMTALEVDKPLAGGGYLIAARIPDPQKPSSEIFGALKLVEVWPLRSWLPLRLMNPKARAGFYSSYWGILPYNFSMLPLDDIAVFGIKYDRGNDK
jgi:4-amino-4-deoxy-L-arabinose transferase-like glycosyltransferase